MTCYTGGTSQEVNARPTCRTPSRKAVPTVLSHKQLNSVVMSRLGGHVQWSEALQGRQRMNNTERYTLKIDTENRHIEALAKLGNLPPTGSESRVAGSHG